VEQVAPELVAIDLAGRPYSVKYHELPALLLNELQKEERALSQQRRQNELEVQLISEQRAVIAAREERREAR
jgi:hypothetical protein